MEIFSVLPKLGAKSPPMTIGQGLYSEELLSWRWSLAVIFSLMEIKIEMEMEIIFLQKWKVRMEFNLKWN